MSLISMPPGLFSDTESRDFNSEFAYTTAPADEYSHQSPSDFGSFEPYKLAHESGSFEPNFREFNNFPYGQQTAGKHGLFFDSVIRTSSSSVEAPVQPLDPVIHMSKASSLSNRSPIAPPPKGLIAPPAKGLLPIEQFCEPKAAATGPALSQVLADLQVPKSSETPASAPAKNQKRRSLSKYNAPPGKITTLMMRNVPCRFSQDDMMALLDSEGFKDQYDWVYLPSNSSSNLGYGFINLPDPEDAARCQKLFTGYKFPGTQSVKVCEVHVAHIQGLENNVKHFHRTSAKKLMMQKPYIKSEAETGQNLQNKWKVPEAKAAPMITATGSVNRDGKKMSPDATSAPPKGPPASELPPASFAGVEVIPVAMKNFFVEDSLFSAQMVL